jgi:hypothetical protein
MKPLFYVYRTRIKVQILFFVLYALCFKSILSTLKPTQSVQYFWCKII